MKHRWICAIALLLGLFGCSTDHSTPPANNTDAPAAVRYPLKVAAITQPGTPWNRLYEGFEQRLRASPDGQRFDLELFILGQLGSEENNLTNLRRGRLQFGGYSLQGASSMVPELSIILAPYLFESEAEVDFVMDQYLREPFSALFDAQGAVLLDWTEVGWTHLYSTMPIVNPDDARGIALRASTAPGAQLFGDMIGSRVISIPFPEVTSALQTGMIQGGQTGIGIYALAGLANEAKHFTLTQHAYDTGVLVANKAWFESLDPAARDAFKNALGTPADSRAFIRSVLNELLADTIPKSGATIHALTPEQRAAWQQKTVGSHERLIAKIGGQAQMIFDQIQVGKAAFRANPAAQKSP
jgi:TRAP-type transport system periplasmic protein